MATLRSNTLVKIIIPVVALGALAIGIRACSDKRVQQEAAVTTLPTLTPEQLRELGVEGDTAQDTLNTLVGKLGEIQRQQGDILEDNKSLKKRIRPYRQVRLRSINALMKRSVMRRKRPKGPWRRKKVADGEI